MKTFIVSATTALICTLTTALPLPAAALETITQVANQPVVIEKWIGHFAKTNQTTPDGQLARMVERISDATAAQIIKIDPEKTYEISGQFKSLDDAQPSRVLFDVLFLDKDQRKISPLSIFPVTETTSLTQACVEGETTLHVQGGPDWPRDPAFLAVALHARDDHSDLPNFDTIPLKSITKSGDHLVLELTQAMPQSLPAGSKVRLHRYADYPRTVNSNLPSQWTKLSFVIGPNYQVRQRPTYVIWPGAAYLRIVIRNQYKHRPKPLPQGEQPPMLLFGNITLTPVDAPDPQATPQQ